MIRFLEGVFILAGMIIGVGMFAVPFSFAAAGFWLGALELILLSCAVLILHLLYGKIVLATPEFHRMPGYVRRHLGRRAELVSWASTLFGTIGTLVAYLAVGYDHRIIDGAVADEFMLHVKHELENWDSAQISET